eukprot:CAMPEP_0175087250 /NCGR_PEP_ID=MMETSP0052_2-20121109/29726_1 /TAXON_ID=51329 ORGANISM="Polytomella parva, Strain SAG 63-3" /NCGR_SAMPLE_ID=MMETSP0052_2 /ASSEMBLY_ACC=CAM_ASM_000194 /LENGTH=615 /DNA_ID=CAMNT_0016359575 /DNA_START=189 /DNA_END=2033 /DNA_ORIENTATION=+
MGCGASRSGVGAIDTTGSSPVAPAQPQSPKETAVSSPPPPSLPKQKPPTENVPSTTPVAPSPSAAAPSPPVVAEVKIDAKPSLRVRRLSINPISFMIPQPPWKPDTEVSSDFARHKDVLMARGAGVGEAAAYFRGLTCANSTPVFAMCEGSNASVVKALLDLVAAPTGSYPDSVQVDALWSLANICAGSHTDAVFISDLSAVDIFLKLLSRSVPADFDPETSPPPPNAASPLLQELSLLALGNLAGSRDRDNSTLPIAAEIIDYDGIRIVTRVLKAALHRYIAAAGSSTGGSGGGELAAAATNPHLGLLRSSMWCLCNLARQRSTKETLDVIPLLTTLLLKVGDIECLAAACQVLDWLAEEPENVLHLRGCLEVLPKLVLWTREVNSCLCTPSLRTLGALCTGFSGELGLGSVDYCQEVVSSGGVEAMLSFLKKSRARGDVEQQREALFALSNVAGASNLAVKALLDEGVFYDVLDLLRESKEETIRMECLYVIANPWAPAVGVDTEVSKQLLKEGLLQELSGMCDPNVSVRLLRLVLTGLQDGLKKGQQLMMWVAKAHETAEAFAQSQGLPLPPPPANLSVNNVAQLYKELGTVAKIQALNGHEDEETRTKANG